MADFYETSYVKPGRDGRKPRLCVTYHDEAGKRHERTRAAEPKRLSALRREAEEWRAQLNAEHEAEEERRLAEEAASAIPTLSEYLRYHVRGRASEGIERSTAFNYSRYADNVLDPEGGLADLRLDQITPEHCWAWMRHLVGERGLCAQSVSQALTMLRVALERAVDSGLIARNPAAKVKGPRVRKTRPNALDRRSVSKLRKWIDEGEGWFRTAVAIALFTGMRRGEVCGLRWRDVDFGRGVIRIRHAISKDADGYYIKPPKNGRPRSVDMPPELVPVLRDRLAEVMTELAKLYGDRAASRLPDLFVCGEVDGTWRRPNYLSARWINLRGQLGIRGLERDRCPFHDLRHTYITYMLMRGAKVKSLMDVVGHSSAAMTLDVYASVDPEETRAMAMTVGAALPYDDLGDDEPTYILPPGYE